jgi:hypothetical protein
MSNVPAYQGECSKDGQSQREGHAMHGGGCDVPEVGG